ncbi:hypothetical protein Pelo_16414 [Pelomyxa schiedti]|nr:hypothetical protein Pelo_16414 [Pelomyxa schiedti]
MGVARHMPVEAMLLSRVLRLLVPFKLTERYYGSDDVLAEHRNGASCNTYYSSFAGYAVIVNCIESRVLELMARAQGYQHITCGHFAGESSGRKPFNDLLVYEKFDYTKFCDIFSGLGGQIVSEMALASYWATNTLTVYRFAGFALMLMTVFIALMISGPIKPQIVLASTRGVLFSPNDAWGFHLSGLTILVTSTTYAYAVQYNMPDALTPVRNKNFSEANSVCRALYAHEKKDSMLVMCGYFFCGAADPLVILTWATYTGVGGGWGSGTRTCVYPLIALSLAANLIHLFPSCSNLHQPGGFVITPRHHWNCIWHPDVISTFMGLLP